MNKHYSMKKHLWKLLIKKSKKYNKIIHDYKKLVKDLKENQEIELQDISLEIPTEVIHTNNIVLNYVF